MLNWSTFGNMSTKKYQIGIKQIEDAFGKVTFGRLLKSHRLAEDMTQVQLAKHLKVSKQNLNDLETGRKLPSLNRALKIAKKLNVVDEVVAQIVIQEQLDRENIHFTVKILKKLRVA